MSDLQSVLVGFTLGTGVLAFLGKWIFVTKTDLQRALEAHEQKEASALKERQGEERIWREKLDDKLDTLLRDLSDLRVKFAEVKYSRQAGKSAAPIPGDSGSEFPRVRS